MEEVTASQWRRAWWLATALHSLWVLGFLSWSVTWSDVQTCGGTGFMASGVYPCWDAGFRVGVWSFVIPIIGLSGAGRLAPYASRVSPRADRDGQPIWFRLAFGIALVVGTLIAITVYFGWLVYRFFTADLS